MLWRNIKLAVANKEFVELDVEGLTHLLQTDDLAIDETQLFKAILR